MGAVISPLCASSTFNVRFREMRKDQCNPGSLLFISMASFSLKGLFTNIFLPFKIHILNSNGVRYSWFWPEGSINAPNSKFLGFNFVPRDLDSRRHMGPGLAAQGTWTRGAGDLDSRRQGTWTRSAKGPGLAAPMGRDLRNWLNLAVTRGTPSSQGTLTRGINFSRAQEHKSTTQKYDIWEIYCHRRVLWTDSQQKFESTVVTLYQGIGHGCPQLGKAPLTLKYTMNRTIDFVRNITRWNEVA